MKPNIYRKICINIRRETDLCCGINRARGCEEKKNGKKKKWEPGQSNALLLFLFVCLSFVFENNPLWVFIFQFWVVRVFITLPPKFFVVSLLTSELLFLTVLVAEVPDFRELDD